MKKTLTQTILMVIAALAVCSCGNKSDLPGYKQTKTGLHYKFIEQNKQGDAVQEGDVLVCEVIMRFNDDTLYANIGEPQRLFKMVDGEFEGDLAEGLRMLHKGDKAIFAVDADKMATVYGNHMPPAYVTNEGMTM